MHSQAREYISQLMKSAGCLDTESLSLKQYRTTSKGIEYLAAVERTADRLAGIETRRAKTANSFLLYFIFLNFFYQFFPQHL
jgi:hypothetical protein